MSGVIRPRRNPPQLLVATLLGGAMALGASACEQPLVIAPVSPDRIEHTPVSGIGGVVFTPTPTPGPSATPTVAPTVMMDPPEPLDVAPGFHVGVFAENVGPVRNLERAPNGDVFASLPELAAIVVLPDRNGDGVAEAGSTWFIGPGLNHPTGMVFSGGALWVANTDGVVRFDYQPGALVASGPPTLVFPLPGGGRNPDRAIIVDDREQLYVGVGTECNACFPTDQRSGTVLRYALDGSGASLFARGFRDPAGMARDPSTGEIWLSDRARDDRGDDGPPDELNLLQPGGDFGWPGCVGDRQRDATLGGNVDCARTLPPTIAFPAHLAPTGMTFNAAQMLPEAMRDDLFVVSAGSTQRTLPIGYKLMRVVMEGGRPTGEVADVVRGWLRPDTRRWGRPVDVEAAADGALLIADNAGGRVYRVTYDAPRPTATPPR